MIIFGGKLIDYIRSINDQRPTDFFLSIFQKKIFKKIYFLEIKIQKNSGAYWIVLEKGLQYCNSNPFLAQKYPTMDPNGVKIRIDGVPIEMPRRPDRDAQMPGSRCPDAQIEMPRLRCLDRDALIPIFRPFGSIVGFIKFVIKI